LQKKIRGIKSDSETIISIILPQSSIRQYQTILTPVILNNYPFLAYILRHLNNLNQYYIIWIIMEWRWHK